MLHEVLSAYLISECSLSTDEFSYDTLPSSPDSIIAIHEFTGNSGLQQIEEVVRSFQIKIRDANVHIARSNAMKIFKALHTENMMVQLTDNLNCKVITNESPSKLDTDIEGRTIYSFNLYILAKLEEE